MNGFVKDAAHEGLGQSQRRRIRGVAAQSVLAAIHGRGATRLGLSSSRRRDQGFEGRSNGQDGPRSTCRERTVARVSLHLTTS